MIGILKHVCKRDYQNILALLQSSRILPRGLPDLATESWEWLGQSTHVKIDTNWEALFRCISILSMFAAGKKKVIRWGALLEASTVLWNSFFGISKLSCLFCACWNISDFLAWYNACGRFLSIFIFIFALVKLIFCILLTLWTPVGNFCIFFEYARTYENLCCTANMIVVLLHMSN